MEQSVDNLPEKKIDIGDLNPDQQKFVMEFFHYRDIFKAAESADITRKKAIDFMSDYNVASVIHDLMERDRDKHGWNLERVEKIYRRIAEYNPNDPANIDMPEITTDHMMKAAAAIRAMFGIDMPKRVEVEHYLTENSPEKTMQAALQYVKERNRHDGIIDIKTKNGSGNEPV